MPFIHTLISPNGELEIELPRFGLQFVQDRHGNLQSKDYRGYVLDEDQQYDDAFARFQQHLVLRDTSNDSTRSRRRVIIPARPVVVDKNGKVSVKSPTESSAALRVSVLDEHPRLRILTTESIEARLQLAVIYAASGSHLPSESLKMTGGEAALNTFRGCMPSRPYSAEALQHLASLSRFSHRTVAHDPEVCANEHDDYEAACFSLKSSFGMRQQLTRTEEHELMGDGAVLYTTEWCSHGRRLPSIELAEAPVDANSVANIEDLLQRKVSSGTVPAMTPEFPISQKSSNKMGKDMLHELQESWKAHHVNPESSLSTTLSALIPELNNILTQVKENRVLMETYLLESIENARSDWRDKRLKTVNRVARPTIVDLLRLAVDPDVLVQLAPRLSLKSRGTIQMANLTFMQLCVLEDKLERVISRSQANSLPSLAYFVEELTCQRSWECRNCPYWLVFEVEGRLQIRPEQHYIAEELIYNPGKVCQLNMGRGKTRVILPMLFLYHSYETRGKIARAHFLSPLLSETRQFMHRVLSAGVLRLPFIEQPFERQTELSLMDVLRMQEAVDDVKQFGGFQIIASEHRLSLELRRLELSLKDSSDDATNQEIIAALDKLLDDEQYINIFDESDAVLHHKYHLVYAIGDATELDGGTERWIVAEALLRVLVGTESKRLQRLLGSAPDLWSGEPDYVERAGAYDGLRLKTGVERLKTLVEWHYERR